MVAPSGPPGNPAAASLALNSTRATPTMWLTQASPRAVIVRMAIDPLMSTVLTAAAKFALGKAVALLPNNARAVDEFYTAMLQDMALAVDAALRTHLAHHEAQDPEFARRVAAALDEREARALFYRLGTEAAQATTKERMRMLAYALAGLYTPDLDAEMRSRVSRAVLALEPSDVVALREVLSGETMRTKASAVGEDFRTAWPLEHEPVLEALIIAGCIQDDNKTRGGLYVTALGRSIVKALELWRQ